MERTWFSGRDSPSLALTDSLSDTFAQVLSPLSEKWEQGCENAVLDQGLSTLATP